MPELASEWPADADTARCTAAGRVIVVSDSLPARNGVGAYYLDLLDQLQERGYATELLGPRPDRWAPRMPLPGDSTQRIWFPSPLRFRRVFRSFRPDSVVVATPGPYGQLGAWWANHLNVPLIAGFHTHYAGVTDLYTNPILRACSRFYFNIADRMLFRRSDLVLGNSDAIMQVASDLGAQRVERIGTLIPKASLRAPVQRAPAPLSRVLFAGRLAPEKNIQFVVDAARELPDMHFTIAGDGPLKDSIREQADALSNLSFLGWVARDELLSQMDAADLLVLPSQLESFGTVALEAMARQRLALVSPDCGIVDWPDLVQHLFVMKRGQSLAEAIRDVAAVSDSHRSAVAATARAAALHLNDSSLQHWMRLLQPGAIEMRHG